MNKEGRMGKLPTPKEGSIFYEDDKVYACLAFEPRVEGHSIVAWKKEQVEDISRLSPGDYQYLMAVVNMARRALLQHYNAPKVYLAYLDEVGDVHWHLFPRKKGDQVKGFDLMCQKAGKLEDLSAVPLLRSICQAP